MLMGKEKNAKDQKNFFTKLTFYAKLIFTRRITAS
jgi:hypothetical protein